MSAPFLFCELTLSPRKKKGSAAQEAEAPPAEASAAAATRDAMRRELAAVVGANAGAIIKAAIKKAKGGHFQSMKFLFAIAGIHPAQTSEEQAGDLSLAQLLCRELGLPEEGTAPAEEEGSQEEVGSAAGECTVK
jgi:hypothetical protein